MVCVKPITPCVTVREHLCSRVTQLLFRCSDVLQFTILLCDIDGHKNMRFNCLRVRFALETIITIIRSIRRQNYNIILLLLLYVYDVYNDQYTHTVAHLSPLAYSRIIIISLHPLSMCNSLNSKYFVRSYRDNREYIIIFN